MVAAIVALRSVIQSVRTVFLPGADVVTYLVREPGDPAGGLPAPPCRSCHALLRHCGFTLQAPVGEAG